MYLCWCFENVFKDRITLKERSINVTGRTFVGNPERTSPERSLFTELRFSSDKLIYLFISHSCPCCEWFFTSRSFKDFSPSHHFLLEKFRCRPAFLSHSSHWSKWVVNVHVHRDVNGLWNVKDSVALWKRSKPQVIFCKASFFMHPKPTSYKNCTY